MPIKINWKKKASRLLFGERWAFNCLLFVMNWAVPVNLYTCLADRPSTKIYEIPSSFALYYLDEYLDCWMSGLGTNVFTNSIIIRPYKLWFCRVAALRDDSNQLHKIRWACFHRHKLIKCNEVLSGVAGS